MVSTRTLALALVVLLGGTAATGNSLASQASVGERLQTSKVAIAAPTDLKFLEDQIDLEFKIQGISEPVLVSTRPGQIVFLSLPEGNGRQWIRKYGFIFFPVGESGVPVKTYTELEHMESERVTFQLKILCIEETPPDELERQLPYADPNIVGGCNPRERDFQFADDVKFFQGREIKLMQGARIVLDEKFLSDQGRAILQRSVVIRLLRYSRGVVEDVAELLDRYPIDSFRCQERQRIELCGCRVTIDGFAVTAGCER